MKESLAAGQLVGSYRILSAWDAGGKDEYFVAEAVEDGVRVMLKPLSGLPDGQLERIARLVEASARLAHPRVARTVEIAEVDGQRYLVSEYVEGRSLAARMRKGIAPPREILATAIGLAEALEQAHAAGLVHGDVRPANVILAADGVKLTGFGSPRRVTPDDAGGRLVEYLTPEEARGQEPDARSDLYCLGVLLYEMAVGRRPFRARTPELTIAQILEAEPDRIERWHPGVPRALSGAILRCLSKDPAQRHASATELLAELRTQHALANPPNRRRQLAIAGAALAVLAIATALYWFFVLDRSRPPQSFAFIGFEVPAGSGQPDYLGSGIAEGVIANLSRLRLGRVMSAGTLARARGRPDLKTVGREFDVEALVRGTIETRRDGGVRLRLEVIDPVTGGRRWSDSFDAGPGELGALPLQATEGLASWADLPLGAEMRNEMSRRYSRKPEALRLFLEGQALRSRRDLPSRRAAIDRFRKAAASDPKFGLAFAALAESLAQPVFAPSEVKDQAAAAALQAISIDERLPEAHLALALARFLQDWNWTDAEREFRRALQLNPGYVAGYRWYAEYMAAMERLAGARSTIQEGDQRDPQDLQTLSTSARISYFGRRYDESLAIGRRIIETAPGFDIGYQLQGSNLVAKNQASEAVAIVSRAGVLVPDAIGAPDLLAMLGCAYANAGHAGGFQTMIEQMRAMSSRRYVSAYHFAMAYTCAGDRENAFQWLTQALAERSPQMVYLNVEPVFDAVRADARFAAIVQQAGLSTRLPAPSPLSPKRPGKR